MTQPGLNVLLVGHTGGGKSTSILTLPDQGITPFVLMTEPAHDIFGQIKCPKLHYKFIPPATPSWDAVLKMGQMINRSTFGSLSKLEGQNKPEYNQWLEVITTMQNFVCDRCGQEFGAVETWGTDRALVIDSLSGLNIMAKDLVTGNKPTASPGEWGVAMDNLGRFVDTCCMMTHCHFVLTAHLEKEHDEESGIVSMFASALGRKLSPKLPRFFNDVVMTRRDGTEFHWSTSTPNVDLKARNLPLSEKLPPSFKLMIDTWKKRGGEIETLNLETTNV